MRSYSPECRDFLREFVKPVPKDDPSTVYVDMNTGTSLNDRSLTERIQPMPVNGLDTYRDEQLSLIDGCPQIVTPSTGPNSLSSTIQVTPLNIEGLPDGSFGFLMTANAVIATYYIMSVTVPAGDHLVTLQSSWGQKSKKTLQKYVRQAVAKLQKVQAGTVDATALASPSPTP
ncbi:MAG: hypothetical protein WCP95_17415 [Actinomycetes bacterium]